ncbi:peroxiredoxin family protein [Candidatus Uabimicrobium sp. HlEnr_7]|uniref:peroxiredoxin family protein n=1 Tax=Candidatus Uabimicrobium helgolandensis TaxID=3095367 RepID=UPI003557B18E
MKYFVILTCLCLTSCTLNVPPKSSGIPKDAFLKHSEVLQQTQVRVANLTRRVDVLEKSNSDLQSKVNSFRQQMGSVQQETQVRPIQYTIPSAQPPQTWTSNQKKMITNLVKKFENSDEKKTPNNELIGNKFPFLRFVNSNGEVIDLSEFTPNKKLVLVVLRGFAGSVCLVCSSQTIALSKHIKKFHEKNAEVILVYPGEIDTIPHFIASVQNVEEGFDLPFPVVLDADLNLVNEFKINGSLAKPSTLIIDEDGIVRYAYVGKHPGDRPAIPSLLKVIDEF